MTSGPSTYAVISSDGHAGAELLRVQGPTCRRQWHDDFDAWAPTYVNPYADLQAPTAYRSWDSERRLEETEVDGIVAEVLFPNTVPPFFDEGNLVALPPTPEDYDRRWAGLQAHNRWLAEFCDKAPGRRAGVVQVFVNKIDDAVAEVRWAKENLPAPGRRPPAVGPAQLAACPASGSRTTTRCGGCARSSTSPSRSTAAAACRTTASTRPPGRCC